MERHTYFLSHVSAEGNTERKNEEEEPNCEEWLATVKR